jgi:SAM-dependent methyltransferase
MTRSLKIFDGAGAGEIERWCPLCGSYEKIARPEYSLPPWRIVVCVECGFVFLANPVNYSDLVEVQAWQKNAKKETARRRHERPVLDRLSKGTRWRLKLFSRQKAGLFLRVFRKGNVLDVGCGGGTSLPIPLIPFGVEISKHLAETANHTMQKRGGHCIHAAAIEGIKSFESRFFDGVLLHSFLEHETNPLPLLREVHRVLSDAGVVYVRVPNFSSVNRRVMGRKWCGFRYPDHVNYFTAGSLSKMAKLAGFEMQILNRINLPFDDNVKSVLRKSDPTPAKLQ